MADLQSIAELAWKQIFPDGADETKVNKEQFIADAKTEFAFQLLQKMLNDKREEGQIDIPSYLMTEKEFEVVNNEVSLAGVNIMRSVPWEMWLINVGGFNCVCKYVKSTANLTQLLCDDDSLDDADKTYFALGKKIKFPKGTHKDKILITYLNSGDKVDGKIEVDDAIGGLVRRSLMDLYLGKIGREDKTNNSESDA